MAIQDVGTIGGWTPARLDRHVANLFGQRNQIAKTSVSADKTYVHNSLAFSAGDFQTSDTIVQRPATGILTINGQQIVTAPGLNNYVTSAQAVLLNPAADQIILSKSLGLTATNNGRTVKGAFIENSASAARFLATNNATTSTVMAVGQTGEAGWRWFVDSDGTQHWSDGTNAADTSLVRVATTAPSSTGVALSSGSRSFVTTSTAGYLYVAATNNLAFQSYFLASDSVPAFEIFTQGALAWGPGGAGAIDLELARLSNSPGGTGTYLELIKGQGLGYGTGTGGAVTQATSFSTGVTLNKPTGVITLFTSATVAGTVSTFTVTNSVVGALDTVVVSWGQGGANNAGLNLSVSSVAAGSFAISFHSVASNASATRTINFAVIKGANA